MAGVGERRTSVRVNIQSILVLWLLPWGLAGTARAVERTTLRENVVTHGDSVYLSDLLPRSASEELRTRTAPFTLGNSPLPGSHRRFERYEIVRTLRGSPELLAQLVVPDEVDVTRWSQPLGREQIRQALAGQGSAGLASWSREMSLDQIEAPGEVLVTDPAARLEVLRVEDAGGPNFQVRMWIPSEPKVLAFWITVHRHAGPDAVARHVEPAVEARDVAESIARPASTSDPADTVKQGSRLELVFFATGMRIMTPALTLDVGRVGQKIRVRSLATGKVLRATLVSAELAELEN